MGAAPRDLPIRLLALLTLANGLLGIVHVLVVRFSDLPRLFDAVLPFGLHHWGRSVTLLTGFLLAYLSLLLFQRRRLAWMFTIAVCAVASAAHLGRGHHAYLGVSPAVTGLLLLGFRKRFTVRSEPRSVAFGLLVFAASVLVALAYGAAGFWLLDRRDFGLDFRFGDACTRSLRELVLVGNADLVARTRHAAWFLESLRLLGVVAGLVGTYSLFRPLAYRLRTLPHERERVRGILQEHGTSSLDFFKTWPDKSYFFSPNERSCIAYRAAWGVAVALGDPVGPGEELEPLIRRFLAYCSDNGWTVAFHQVLPNLVPLYERLELNVLKIGEEARIDLGHFATTTALHGTFPRVRRRLQAQGYRFARHVPPHQDVLLAEVEEISREWLSLPGRRERGFTLGKFERSSVGETPLCLLRQEGGPAIAFVNEIPCYPEGDATIDLMRHRVEIPNGTMDLLFTELLLELRRLGYRRFDLGLAPLAGIGDRPGATLQERALHQLFEHLNRFFSYRGLRTYKAKFDPVWEDRFLAYQGGPAGLVRTAIALARVTEE